MANDRLKALLSDLGRATLRGVRKCPKCGTFNGTRGLSCKNKACDVVFKEAGERRKMSTEACKLVTGNATQVYSVRVRDKGPDYRGFVQLPVVQNGTDGEHYLDSDMSLITQTSALCFVDTCQRSFDTSVLKCHEKTTPSGGTTCQHIQAALRCYTEAQALILKRSVLSSLNTSFETKQTIWQLAINTTGPLVQRVSKNIMAVKCKASPKHPLGYLHFSFFMSKLRDRIENKYFCSCTAFKGQVKHATNKDDPNFKKCVHFYACICAFASDPKLSEEFAYYINLDKPVFISTQLVPVTTVPNEHQLVAILSEEGTPCEVEVEVLPDDAALLDATSLAVADGGIAQVHGLEVISDPVEVQIQTMQDGLNFSSVGETSVLTDPSPPIEMMSMKRKREDQASSALLTLQETGSLNKRPNGGNNVSHMVGSSSCSGVIGKKTSILTGNTSPDQVEPTPFLIEWIPDILPKSKIGELKIRFEFGHQKNGLVDKRTATNSRNILKIVESHPPSEDNTAKPESPNDIISI